MALDPHKIIKNLEEEIIDGMLNKFFNNDELLDLGRGLQLKALSDTAISTGVDYVFNKCTKPILFEFERGESYATGGPENEKSRSKPIVVENLCFKCAERGFAEFLKGKDVTVIEKMAEKIKVTGDDKEELIENIIEEANYQGLSKLFEAFTPRLLKEWCKLMDIHIDSSSKKRLAKGLIYGEDSGPTSTRQYGQAEEEKADLVAGTSEEDIKNSYTVNELKKFCAKSEIPGLGTKDVLVNRIYRFLQGEKIDENEGKRKKSEGGEDSPPVEKKQKVEEPLQSLTSSSDDEYDSGDDYQENGGNPQSKKTNGRKKKTEVESMEDDEDEPMGDVDDKDEPMGEANTPSGTAVPVAEPIISSVSKHPEPTPKVEMPTGEIENTPVENTPIETTPVEKTPIETTPIETTPIETTPEHTPIENTSIKTTPIETAPIETTPENTPIENTSIKTTPIETTPENTPIENTSNKTTPAETTPVIETPILPSEPVTENTPAPETTPEPTPVQENTPEPESTPVQPTDTSS